MVEPKATSRWRDVRGWLVILAGAAVFVAALAVPLDDPALVVALMLALRGGRLALDLRPATVAESPADPGEAAL
jgi:hypothetical protein